MANGIRSVCVCVCGWLVGWFEGEEGICSRVSKILIYLDEAKGKSKRTQTPLEPDQNKRDLGLAGLILVRFGDCMNGLRQV
jgi:hypothetical protein